ncbi:PH domain-containing protein [Methanofollis formosanus]|uniref:PH domain-containing protein n=1 Tax=Methanofollis formosanus TaxID=299308 RepID=A0A8G1A3U4_9EURY|nr:PH domain-containing protein [Methanofollis formosanus]QYZ79923.1 PH domain-containing protein [Methanofollis formosanus]
MTYLIRIGEDFKPAPQFKRYYFLSLVILAVLGAFFIVLPVSLTGEGLLILLFGGGMLALLIFVAVWIPLYYRSIVYHLTETEMTWKRGVWFRSTGIVPYNRITNVDIIQGPVMRLFGISNLRIQTAGYSAQAQAEIRILGIEDPEPLRELIMAQVRGRPPVAAVTGGEEEETAPAPVGAGQDAVVAELRAIRELLEKMAGR